VTTDSPIIRFNCLNIDYSGHLELAAALSDKEQPRMDSPGFAALNRKLQAFVIRHADKLFKEGDKYRRVKKAPPSVPQSRSAK